MHASVIFTTYNQPRYLELVLWGYAAQTRRDFEVVVADDGSGPETRDVIDRLRGETGLTVRHVWHEDRGFRKTEILNRAILAAAGDYLVFSDGDCVPRKDFVDAHLRLAERGRFLSGGYLKLPERVSRDVTPEVVRTGRIGDLAWLRKHGWRPGRHALRLVGSQTAATVLDLLTPTRATWNGHNASAFREAVLAVNGFDLDMAYGGLDRAVGERMENAGIFGKQVRFRAPVLHLHHKRPWADPERHRANHEIRARIRATRETRAPRGLEQVAAGADGPNENQETA